MAIKRAWLQSEGSLLEGLEVFQGRSQDGDLIELQIKVLVYVRIEIAVEFARVKGVFVLEQLADVGCRGVDVHEVCKLSDEGSSPVVDLLVEISEEVLLPDLPALGAGEFVVAAQINIVLLPSNVDRDGLQVVRQSRVSDVKELDSVDRRNEVLILHIIGYVGSVHGRVHALEITQSTHDGSVDIGAFDVDLRGVIELGEEFGFDVAFAQPLPERIVLAHSGRSKIALQSVKLLEKVALPVAVQRSSCAVAP